MTISSEGHFDCVDKRDGKGEDYYEMVEGVRRH